MSDDKLSRPSMTAGGVTSFEEALALYQGGAQRETKPQPFTPRAVELFQRLKRTMTKCTCTESIISAGACVACKTADQLQWDLHRELKLKPWDDLAVVPPDGWKWWQDADALRRWYELEAALKPR
jgi:hypothetical protein